MLRGIMDLVALLTGAADFKRDFSTKDEKSGKSRFLWGKLLFALAMSLAIVAVIIAGVIYLSHY